MWLVIVRALRAARNSNEIGTIRKCDQHFEPIMTHSWPSSCVRQAIAAISDPAFGSDMANAPITEPSHVRHLLTELSIGAHRDRPVHSVAAGGDARDTHTTSRRLLCEQTVLERFEAQAAQEFGNENSEKAEIAHSRDQIGEGVAFRRIEPNLHAPSRRAVASG